MMKFRKIVVFFILSFAFFVNDSYSSDRQDANLIDRYKNVLAAAKEVGIGELPNPSLRILWFRSFHEPAIFTLSRLNETHVIITKTLNIASGYDTGEIKSVHNNTIDEAYVSYLYQTLINTCRFNELPEKLPPVSMDGSTIVIELHAGGSYHVVETQSMKSGECINKVAKLVMILSGVDFNPVY